MRLSMLRQQPNALQPPSDRQCKIIIITSSAVKIVGLCASPWVVLDLINHKHAAPQEGQGGIHQGELTVNQPGFLHTQATHRYTLSL